MKSQLFVLISYDVPPEEIDERVSQRLEPHRFDPDQERRAGRFDYLVGAFDATFDDPATLATLPAELHESFAGRICRQENLPRDRIPAALLTPDGQWHDLEDFGWRLMQEPSKDNSIAYANWSSHYHKLIDLNPSCWVISVWAHS